MTYVNFFSLFQFVIQLFDLCIIIFRELESKKGFAVVFGLASDVVEFRFPSTM